MAFEIINEQAGSPNSAIYTISANTTNNNILWYLYYTVNGVNIPVPQSSFVGSTPDSPIMNVDYTPCGSTSTGVIWQPNPLAASGPCAVTSAIKIEYKTVLAHTLYVSAGASSESDEISINPRYITLNTKTISPKTISINAKYTNPVNAPLTLPSNWKVEWTVNPAEDIQIRLGGGGPWLSNANYISGQGSSALTFELSSTSSVTKDHDIIGRIFDDTGTSIAPREVRGSINETFRANPKIGFRFIDTLSNSATAQATLGIDPMPMSPLPSLSWSISPLGPSLTQSSNLLYITGPFDYSKDYTITLIEDSVYNQTYTSNIDGQKFRPWKSWSASHSMTVTLTYVEDIDNITRYLVKVTGNDGSNYNFDPALVLKWFQLTDSNSLAFLNDGLNTEYGWENIAYTWYGDDIYIDVVNEIVDRVPQEVTRDYRAILYDYTDGLDQLAVVSFSINSFEYISDEFFYPDYVFQYEPKEALIYRPIQSGTSTYTIFFENNSFPSAATNKSVRLIHNGIPSPWQTITSTTGTTSFSISINRSTPAEHVIFFETRLTLGEGTFNKNSRRTTIKFTNIPDASQFSIYPEYIWNQTINNWAQVYIEPFPRVFNLLNPSPGTSIYGMCHTENFLLSASPSTDANLLTWAIDGFQSNIIVNSTTKQITVPITSPGNTTTTHHITARAYNDNLDPNMPTKYYDTPAGTFFANYYDTRNFPTTVNRNAITLNGVSLRDSIFTSIDITPGSYCTVPGTLNLRCTLNSDPLPTSPFSFIANSIIWQITKDTPDQWVYILPSNILSNRELSLSVPLTINNSNLPLTIPDFRTSPLSFSLTGIGSLGIKTRHPRNNSWCTQLIQGSNDNIPNINAIPMSPLIYTYNKYVSENEVVTYENASYNTLQSVRFQWAHDTKKIIYTPPNVYNSFTHSFSGTDSTDIDVSYSYQDTYNQPNTITNTFNNTVFVEDFQDFNPNIDRVRGKYTLKLPFDVKIASNDVLTHDNINECYKNVYNNLLYIIDKAKLYDPPPTSYEGWLGTVNEPDGTNVFRWRINFPGLDLDYDNPENAIDNTSNFGCNHMEDIISKNNVFYIANNNPTGAEIVVTDTGFIPKRISSRNVKSIDDFFNFIKTIQVTDNNRVYALDTLNMDDVSTGSRNEVIVFDYNPTAENQWTLLQSWGGLGGRLAKYKFNNPQDILVDRDNVLWVADTDNLCIKKYSGSGSWLETITMKEFTPTTKPISLCQDSDDRYHILLSDDSVIRIDSSKNIINKYRLAFEETTDKAVRVRASVDGGFIYSVNKKSIIKVRNDSVVQYLFASEDQYVFASTSFNNAILNGYNGNYRSCYHDKNRNFLIVSNNHILKYIDKLTYTSLIVDGIESYLWKLDEIYIKKDEYVQDWVINKALHRLWDNIEMVRRFIIGKYSYKAITNTYTTSSISITEPPDDFNYCEADWLPQQLINITTNKICNVVPIIRTFNPDEYKLPPYTKDDIYLGINEFVTSDVINRCLDQLYEFLQTLIDMINDVKIDRDNLCDTEKDGVERVSNSVGACCLPNGTCRVITRFECETLGGEFQGPCIGCNGERL